MIVIIFMICQINVKACVSWGLGAILHQFSQDLSILACLFQMLDLCSHYYYLNYYGFTQPLCWLFKHVYLRKLASMAARSWQKGTGPPFYFNNYIILYKLITTFVKQLTFWKNVCNSEYLSFHGMILTIFWIVFYEYDCVLNCNDPD